MNEGGPATATVMFSDIEGSTDLVERLGDAAWLEVLRVHNAIVRQQIEVHRGFEVKSMGDGFMVVFSDPEAAVRCAVAVQQRLADRLGRDPDRIVRVRMGLHSGELLRDADDYFGRAVVMAARISALARGGEILVSEALRAAVDGAPDLRFDAGRPIRLKGLAGRQVVHEVLWAGRTRPVGRGGAPLIGREREIARVAAVVGDAARGSGRVLVVSGPAGIGKSALLEAVGAAVLPHEAVLLQGRANVLESAYGFGIVRQLFEPSLKRLPDAARDRVVRAAGAAAPLLEGAPPSEPMPGNPSEPVPYPLLLGLTDALRELAQTTVVVLAVDDVQWADEPSAVWLEFVARRVPEMPVVLAVAVRVEDEPSEGAVEQLVRSATAERLDLVPLDPDGSGSMVQRTFPHASPRFLAACHGVCGGNPFLLRELLATCAAEGIDGDDEGARRVAHVTPHAVRRMVLDRIGGLPAPVRRLVEACAVLGSEADLRLAGRLARLEPAEAVQAADALCRIHVLRARRPLQFEHPVIRATIEDSIPFGTRSTLHRQAAAALHEAGTDPQLVALHLLATDPAGDAAVVELLVAAAADAAASGTPAVALPYLQRAIDEPAPRERRLPLTVELARLELLAGRHADAERRLRQALRAGVPPVPRAQIVLLLARAVEYAVFQEGGLDAQRDDAEEALALLEEATADLPPEERELRFALEAQALGIRSGLHAVRSTRPGPAESRRLAELAAEASPDGSLGERAVIAVAAAQRAVVGDPVQEWLPMVRRILADGSLMREYGEGGPGYDATDLLLLADELPEAGEHLRAADRHARRVGSSATRVYLQTELAACALLAGDLVRARAHLEGAQRHGGGAPAGDYSATIWHGTAAAVALLAGDAGAAWTAASDIPHPRLRHHVRGLAALARHEFDAAIAELEPAQAILDARGQWRTTHPLRAVRPDLAVALAAAGRRHQAEAVAAAELAVAERSGIATAVALALRAHAAAHPEQAMAALERAAALVARSPARLVEAQVLHDLAALVLAEEPASAYGDDLAARAAAIAAACGAAWPPPVALPV